MLLSCRTSSDALCNTPSPMWGLLADSATLLLQDWLDIDFAIKEQVDFIAVSFVKTSDVINNLKSYVESRSARVST